MGAFKRSVTKVNEMRSDAVFKGQVNVKKDGYLVTSYPYEKGYEIYMDGKNRMLKL